MSLEQLTATFVDTILPTWAISAYDEPRGQFVEYLELDGRPQRDGLVRTRTVARQIYVHAHASVLGVAPAASLDIAETAFANMHLMAWIGGKRSGYARAFDRMTGDLTDPTRDLYDNACVLLALSWLLKATGKNIYRRRIDATIAAIDDTLRDPFGGWAEDSNGTLPRRQNPHMHYLEATLALCENNRTPAHLRTEKTIFSLLRSHFFVGPHGPLHEHFGPRWEIADKFGSATLEPGHMCEWIWLIGRHDALNHSAHAQLSSDLLTSALSMGRASGSPFLFDLASAKGEPLAASKRLWPQVEMLKALLTLAGDLEGKRYQADAETLARQMLATYFQDVPPGCWHDRLDLGDKPIGTNIPASSLYHLWTAVAELLPQTP